jgi:threonine aldolase
MNFGSDNLYGVHPKILEAIAAVNGGTAPAYGGDEGTEAAEQALSTVFETPVKMFFVATGTAANGLALSAIAPSHGAVLAHANAHISADECNAPEFFTDGAKLLLHYSADNKVTPAQLHATLTGFLASGHGPKATAVSITNATEFGTVYKPQEIKAISDLIKPRGLKLHMDGARFANAVVGAGATPAELTWKSGVDVMSFGATKNGAMLLEAVVFFDHALAADFNYRRLRAGQVVSKSRYLAAQMLAYLKDGLWLDTARHANGVATYLSRGLNELAGVRVVQVTEANEVFAIMPRKAFDAANSRGAKFYEWPIDGVAESDVHCRFVTSWNTAEKQAADVLALLKEVL